MYQTTLLLNPANYGAVRDMQSPYAMHQTLSRIVQADDRPLFAVDRTFLMVLLQTRKPPRIEALDPSYLDDVDGPNAVVRQFFAGQRWRFALAANPTVCRDRKRFGLAGERAQRVWFERKAADHGFHVDSMVVRTFTVVRDPQPTTKAGIPHKAVWFRGRLTVDDVQRFTHAANNGIGPAKAFGFGLL